MKKEKFNTTRPAHNHRVESFSSPRRDRKSTLLRNILDMARADGTIAEAESILDYALFDDTGLDSCLTDYRFDLTPDLCFGSCEGIYLSLHLYGSFDASGERKTTIGRFKTLRTDLEACWLMGALGGALMYYGRKYVDQELHRYTPTKDLIQGLTQQGGDGMNAAAPSQYAQKDEVR